MGRKVTDTQRIINFGMSADGAALNQAIESLIAIRGNRFPKTKAQAARKPRRPRTPATFTPAAAPAGEPAEN